MNQHNHTHPARRVVRAIIAPPLVVLSRLADHLKRVEGFDTITSIIVRSEAARERRHVRFAASSARLSAADVRRIQSEIDGALHDPATPGVIDAREVVAIERTVALLLQRGDRHAAHLAALGAKP